MCEAGQVMKICGFEGPALSPGVSQGRLSLTGAETQADPVQPREDRISSLPTFPSRGERKLPLADGHILWNHCIFQHEVKNNKDWICRKAGLYA